MNKNRNLETKQNLNCLDFTFHTGQNDSKAEFFYVAVDQRFSYLIITGLHFYTKVSKADTKN